eukprot:TRINITY_DN775864_c0_g1_i1.p1 TRINITY_DN775864_c0_g1~~TRINITY_DN775864_c0_g1_i1.p1  ORF type:complete len:284 (-),score=105.46 TRINITY_DN775864_c0_g1_i1:146-997(-)
MEESKEDIESDVPEEIPESDVPEEIPEDEEKKEEPVKQKTLRELILERPKNSRKRKRTDPEERKETVAMDTDVDKPTFGPRLRLVNGKMVVDQDSLKVTTDIRDSIFSGDMSVVHETGKMHVNALSFRKVGNRSKWTIEETKQLYRCLRQCGTDFAMIAQLIPTKSRKQIRMKFKKEEKEHPRLVGRALKCKAALDETEFTEAPAEDRHAPLLEELNRQDADGSDEEENTPSPSAAEAAAALLSAFGGGNNSETTVGNGFEPEENKPSKDSEQAMDALFAAFG